MLAQRILVALDLPKIASLAESGSQNTSVVFKESIELVRCTKGQLLLVYIIDWEADESEDLIGTIGDRSVTGENLGVRKEYLAHKFDRARKYLQPFEDRAKEEGIAFEVKIEVGSPSEKICQIAKDWQADLISIGSRGYCGITEAILGSVSNYVTHHAHCSVLIVRDL
jgi:nucleotide-binding universal stress UspA family protein